MTQPPPELEYGVDRLKDIRYIARRQKIIIGCILVYFLVIVTNIFLRVIDSPDPLTHRIVSFGMLGVALLLLGNMIVALVSAFGLAIRLKGTALGILLGILLLFPCINLLVLLVINGQATSELRKAGVKVGFWGAKGPIV